MDILNIGNQFVAQYYKIYDTKATRGDVCQLYHPTDSCLTFEGLQCQGAAAVGEKHKSMPFNDLLRDITALDIQPLSDNGVLIQILGQLRTTAENDKVMPFSQTFVLRPFQNNFFVYNDVFRLVLHNA